MCGFAGFVDFKKNTPYRVLQDMADAIVHRGPDDSGYELMESVHASIGFGFRRLSVIDLSPNGHQPMFSGNKKLVLMMNGEIYNYRELKSELEVLGCVFNSKSDTEVVLNAYQVWGVEMVHRFIGMFAIVLFDDTKQELFLLRDRAGIKPLFWGRIPGGILFGSELKSFHSYPSFKRQLNRDALALYFMNGSIPAPYTIFKDTFKLQPGHWMKVDLKTGETTDVEYWNAYNAYNAPVSQLNYEEAKTELEVLMKSSFNYRMIADVPVGVFLSGGYDSTAVVAMLSDSVSNLNTYTIGFDDPLFNEAPHAAMVAKHLGTNHHEYTCEFSDAMAIIPELPEIYDEPFGDPSAIPTILVSRIAKRYVTVALSADGGDELFAGYPRHRKLLTYISNFEKIPVAIKRSILGPVKLISNLSDSPISKSDRLDKLSEVLSAKTTGEYFNIINQTYTENEIRSLIKEAFEVPHVVFNDDSKFYNSVTVLNKILAIEYRTYLTDDIMQKVDRATMSVGLEGREPFLDHRLLEFVSGLPENYKYYQGNGKRILKDIVHKYVPERVMDRPKMGFGVPIKDWLKLELRDLFEEVLDVKKIERQSILNPDKVMELKQAYLDGKLNDIYRLWYVFVFQQWYDKWMD